MKPDYSQYVGNHLSDDCPPGTLLKYELIGDGGTVEDFNLSPYSYGIASKGKALVYS